DRARPNVVEHHRDRREVELALENRFRTDVAPKVLVPQLDVVAIRRQRGQCRDRNRQERTLLAEGAARSGQGVELVVTWRTTRRALNHQNTLAAAGHVSPPATRFVCCQPHGATRFCRASPCGVFELKWTARRSRDFQARSS